jgi:hypothetical protein
MGTRKVADARFAIHGTMAPVSLSFSLDKWYMDLVAEDGEVVVGYAADVHLFALHLHYASILMRRGGQTRSMASLRKATPVVEDKTLRWTSRALGVRGTWTADGEGTKETLLSGDAGSVEWDCLMPLAKVEIELEGGRIVRGLGYAEHLTMSIAPWDLPIDELRWGRFTAEGASVVWLEWRGPQEKRIVLKHGARVSGVIEDRRIEVPDDEARVTIEDGALLRDGPLGSSALGAIAELHPILPGKLLGIVERKIVAPATLEQPFASAVRGWAISEVVTWPKERQD